MSYLPILPEIVLTAAILFLTLVVVFYQGENRNGVMMTGTIFGLSVTLLTLAFVPPFAGYLFSGMLTLDGMAFFFRWLFPAVGLFVAFMAREFLEVKKAENPGEFYVILLLAILGMMLMASSGDLITIYLGLELTSISSYILAGYLREDPKSGEAAIKYFLMGALASGVLLFGMSLFYGLTGATNLVSISGILHQVGAPPLVLAAMVFLIIGLGFKVAAVPFHMWAPDAYEGAPTPVTAFFSVGPKAAAFAAIIRVFTDGLSSLVWEWSLAFAVLALITMTLGNLTALWQKNVKRMLAYSSIAHAGYIMVGLAAGTWQGTVAMLLYLLAYVFTNLGIFAVVTALGNREGKDELTDFTGLSQRSPYLAAALVVFFLSLIGIPFTAGFFGKFLLFGAAVQSGLVWLALVMAVNSAISVGYYYTVVRNMYLVAPKNKGALPVAGELKLVVTVALLVTLILGLFFEPVLGRLVAFTLPG
ncbi:MAG: NADH-quinone oxidoreductase subunit N [Firmicutes bacterium]|nr:NADH-quinone oxidoreductase subunit N [Bacillota bacterium]MCL5039024.1 NADH-quinone oxidoreductase subunit N [Bacillota bacterium]